MASLLSGEFSQRSLSIYNLVANITFVLQNTQGLIFVVDSNDRCVQKMIMQKPLNKLFMELIRETHFCQKNICFLFSVTPNPNFLF